MLANKSGGFSLIEVLIAIAIMMLILGVAVPAYMRFLAKGRKNSAVATLRVLKLGIDQFNADVGQNPNALVELVEKPRDAKMAKKWEGPYLEKEEIPDDPWGSDYQYKKTPSGKKPYELYSYGPKKEEAVPEEWISVWQ